MLLKEYINEFFKLSIFERYAIFSVQPYQILNNDTLKDLRLQLKAHYQSSPFVIIREESEDLEVDFSIYQNRSLKNIKGLAIVSQKETVRERALKEQSLFDDSFAFFHEIESAKNWAESFFR